jgi:hypothetical protein
MSVREVLLVVHTGRQAAVTTTTAVSRQLCAAGVGVRVLETEADELDLDGATVVPVDKALAGDVELVLVVGGDGTLLRAAELAWPVGTPVLGVNLGRVGFLTSMEASELDDGIARVFAGEYRVVELPTLVAGVDGTEVAAINDVVTASAVPGRMIELAWAVSGEDLGQLPCDGVICATPTGSTAYNLSNGLPPSRRSSRTGTRSASCRRASGSQRASATNRRSSRRSRRRPSSGATATSSRIRPRPVTPMCDGRCGAYHRGRCCAGSASRISSSSAPPSSRSRRD